jgi:CRISPR type III-A-associated RAMP protein Csm4
VGGTYVLTIEPSGAGIPPEGARSDTLHAALRSVAAETGALADAFAGPAPPFRVSSLFPEVEGVRLYPRPRAEPAAFASLDPFVVEPFRRIWSGFQHVTEARLESLAEGRRVRFEPEDIIGGRAWGMPSERGLGGLPRSVRTPGAMVDRAGGGVDRFDRRRTIFPSGGRFFFIARLDQTSFLAPFRDLVARLGDAGLGGRRSTGGGRFSLAGATPAPLFLWEGDSSRAGSEEGAKDRRPPARLLLSLYLPSREEVAGGVLDGMAGETVLRGGWIGSGGATSFRKRPVRMIAEGTVLPGARTPLAGECRDVRPEGFDRHPVWRDGRPLDIPYGGAA